MGCQEQFTEIRKEQKQGKNNGVDEIWTRLHNLITDIWKKTYVKRMGNWSNPAICNDYRRKMLLNTPYKYSHQLLGKD